jgi:hypothetical protein
VQLNATVTVVGPAAAGALTYTPPAGTVLGLGADQTLMVTAAATHDYNAAVFTVPINVEYGFSGFQGRLEHHHQFELGDTIRIKFRLTDAVGDPITDLHAVRSLLIAPVNANGTLGQAFAPASADRLGLHVHRGDGDRDDGYFTFNWRTKKLHAGAYKILLTLADGTVRTTVVNLVKHDWDRD